MNKELEADIYSTLVCNIHVATVSKDRRMSVTSTCIGLLFAIVVTLVVFALWYSGHPPIYPLGVYWQCASITCTDSGMDAHVDPVEQTSGVGANVDPVEENSGMDAHVDTVEQSSGMGAHVDTVGWED